MGEPVIQPPVNLQAIIVWSVIAAVTLTVLIRRGALSPGKLRRSPQRSPDSVPWMLWLFLGFGLYALLAAGAAAGAGVAAVWRLGSGSIATQAVTMWTGYGVAIVTGAIVISLHRKKFARAGIRSAPRDGWIGVVGYLLTLPLFTALLLVAAWVAATIRGEGADPVAHEVLAELVAAPHDWAWWAVVAAVVLAAPVIEELIYRGCLQSALITGTGSPTIAIFLTAAVFAVAHGGSVRVEALLGLFVLGVAFGLLFERTGRIGAAIVMHAVFNAASLGQALLLK